MISKAMRDKVLKRDNSTCWHCGEQEAISIQHRMNRGMGGSRKLDRFDNLIVLCSEMNLAVESNSAIANEAKDMGWKLSSWSDFSQPVFNKNELTWYQIDINGDKQKTDPPDFLI